MTLETLEPISEEQRIALAHTPKPVRPKLEAFFALDHRLGQLVAKATEPMLGQMRLAWWREMLAKPVGERPSGDAVLDALGAQWAEDERPLADLVDAWELLVAEESLGSETILAFAEKRAGPLTAFADAEGSQRKVLQASAMAWALAETAAHMSDGDERQHFIKAGQGLEPPPERLARDFRGVAILGTLGRRSLRRGGRPLMEGRGAGALAFRVGLLGR